LIHRPKKIDDILRLETVLRVRPAKLDKELRLISTQKTVSSPGSLKTCLCFDTISLMASSAKLNGNFGYEDNTDYTTLYPWNSFAVPLERNENALTAQHDLNISNWNNIYPSSLEDGFDEDNIYTGPSSGFVTPDLVTRSNTPSSLPSPGTGSSAAYTDRPVYISRLPRRRSLYSRQGPPVRPSLSPRVATGPAWSSTFFQTADASDPQGCLSLASNEPLRRSNSSTSLASECSNSSTHSTASASSAASTGRRSSSSNRRQRKKAASTSASKKIDSDTRPFKCTFCCDAFKSKYDWRRHEKSLHLDLEVWKCAPMDGMLTESESTESCCAYCGNPSPDSLHLEIHHHQACINRATAARCFRRRDHLAQHLRVFHKLHDLPQLDNWVEQAPAIKSRCGFCNSPLASWDERADHLAGHFRQGCTMRDWQGGHGFDDNIAARLTNALPPYYLATESQSLVPFSATSAEAKDHFAQISARTAGAFLEDPGPATSIDRNQPFELLEQVSTLHTPALLDSRARSAEAFADILASHLARFALEYRRAGVYLSDDMLQREARQVLYSSDDPWNQTIADSPMWLKEFRDRHGLN
jgi:hypothetical protein